MIPPAYGYAFNVYTDTVSTPQTQYIFGSSTIPLRYNPHTTVITNLPRVTYRTKLERKNMNQTQPKTIEGKLSNSREYIQDEATNIAEIRQTISSSSLNEFSQLDSQNTGRVSIKKYDDLQYWNLYIQMFWADPENQRKYIQPPRWVGDESTRTNEGMKECIRQWATLSAEQKALFNTTLDSKNQKRPDSATFIENPYARQQYVIKSIAHIREQFETLRKRAGYESVSIIVPNRSSIGGTNQTFGTSSGEHFYRRSLVLQSLPDDFHVFAQNEYLESIGRLIPGNPIATIPEAGRVAPTFTNNKTSSSDLSFASFSSSPTSPRSTRFGNFHFSPIMENFSSNEAKKIMREALRNKLHALLGTTNRTFDAAALAKHKVEVVGWPKDIPFTTDIGKLSAVHKKRVWECMDEIEFCRSTKIPKLDPPATVLAVEESDEIKDVDRQS
ncbi:hypothetical protein G9A89_019154 [Geosiphon pyriformis]|nr:hypothetical protein G9A89_019154 [Geosiphon pyriformis]